MKVEVDEGKEEVGTKQEAASGDKSAGIEDQVERSHCDDKHIGSK